VRFLVDENIPKLLVDALTQTGHEVAWVSLLAPGSSDRDVIRMAMSDARIILTFDKDFGELARTSVLCRPSGVILLRLPMAPLPSAVRRLADTIATRTDWPGHSSVVETSRIRMKPLPLV
jgi:predicted nuclease of predicted toxin-antitoxin system